MCVAVIGELQNSGWSYHEAAARAGFELWMLAGPQVSIASRIKHLNAMVIITDKVSPNELREAMKIANEKDIPAMCTICEGSVFCGMAGDFSCSPADNDIQN